MCDLLVIAATDVTPEHWADFIQTADLTEDVIGQSSGDPPADTTPPYTLVYSRSQEEFSRTGDLAQQVKTEFSNASYAEMFAMAEQAETTDPRSIISKLFMVLDKQSEEDRKVVLISQSSRTLYTEDENDAVWFDGVDDIIWRRHRIPFEKAASFWLLVMAMPRNDGDEFLQNSTLRSINGL